MDGGFSVRVAGAEGSDGYELRAAALVVATGGRSYPKTGSSGDAIVR